MNMMLLVLAAAQAGAQGGGIPADFTGNFVPAFLAEYSGNNKCNAPVTTITASRVEDLGSYDVKSASVKGDTLTAKATDEDGGATTIIIERQDATHITIAFDTAADEFDGTPSRYVACTDA